MSGLALRALALVALACLSGKARAAPPLCLPVVVHVATQTGRPVVDDAFVREQLARANDLFEPLGVQLVITSQRRLGARHAQLDTRGARDALAHRLVPGVVNWFVVARLMDVDEAGRERRGVHWHLRTDPSRHYVIVSRIAGPYVLAHELGHFFGNRAHSDTPGNLMSYTQTEQPPVLDEAQAERVRETAASMVQAGALSPLVR